MITTETIAKTLGQLVSQNIQSAALDKPHCQCNGQGWYAVFDPTTNGGYGSYRYQVCICQKIRRTHTETIHEEFFGKKFSDILIYEKGWNLEELDDPGNKLAVNIAKYYVEHFSELLPKQTGPFFLGRPGRGKTLICSIMYQELCNMGYYPIYIHLEKFFNQLKSSYQRNQSIEEQAFENISQSDLVFLDDIRITEKSTGQNSGADNWQQGKFLRILNTAKLIVADSNFDLQWIARNMGEHIASRLAGKCGNPIIVGGPDHRIALGNDKQSAYLKYVI